MNSGAEDGERLLLLGPELLCQLPGLPWSGFSSCAWLSPRGPAPGPSAARARAEGPRALSRFAPCLSAPQQARTEHAHT